MYHVLNRWLNRYDVIDIILYPFFFEWHVESLNRKMTKLHFMLFVIPFAFNLEIGFCLVSCNVNKNCMNNKIFKVDHENYKECTAMLFK